MKKLCIVFILFLTILPKLDAQIFYNIEKPHSYQKFGLTTIKELLALNYAVDGNGNCYIDKLSVNMKDYLKIEKIDGKNIARIKFNVASHSLGEMTLRFKDVKLNNGAYCYVYTSDYQIVAGPVYQKSINDMLNIVKIPANELVLEIIFNSEQDYNLIFSSISFQSIDDFKPKSKNSLQEDLTNWDGDNYGIDGNPKYYDNISQTYSENSASYLGAWYDCDLLNLQNLYSVNDEKIAASRASCIIMEPPHLNTEPPYNWIDYWGANSGTLMNFPESDCAGIIFTSYHLGFINQICALTVKENNNNIFSEELAILNNTIIRFNWHHKYGKPSHLAGCSQNDFALWRKTIDFDEVIDYCGVRGVAYAPNTMGFPDYAILEMNQTPFYKELHLGWTTQRIYDFNSLTDLNNPRDFSILGRYGATPTYLFKNSGGFVERMGDWAAGIQLKVIDSNDPALPQLPQPADPRVRSFSGWSGSQLLYPYYKNESERIGLGITKSGNSTELMSYTYAYIFNYRDCNIIDTSLTIAFPSTGNDLYNKYLKLHIGEFNVEDDFYWMPSLENRYKCPSTTLGTEPCNFFFTGSHKITTRFEKGKIIVTIRINEISPDNFPGGIYPKGVRIYNAASDEKTFYFDTFVDDEDIESIIEFTIDQCDIFYFMNNGYNPIILGFDFYDEHGKIINNQGCDLTYAIPITPVKLCDILSVTTARNETLPNPCCSYTVSINFEGCSDYGNIIPRMLEQLTLKNLSTNMTVPLSSISNRELNYLDGKIILTIDGICDPTTFEINGLFGNNNCEPFIFTLDCVIPEPACDCCKVFGGEVGIEWWINSNNQFCVEPHKFNIKFIRMGNENYQTYCPDCIFSYANVYCPNPNPNITTPIFNETFIPIGDGWSPNRLGSLEGMPAGTYCFYFEIHTNSGICLDTFCIYYNGTFIDNTPSPPGPIIEINRDNDTNPYCPLIIKLDYDELYFVDINGKVIIQCEPIDKIDVSKLSKGTYNILYGKNDKIVQSQKLIIK